MKDIFAKRENFRPFEYPVAYDFWQKQIDHPWTPSKIDVSADVQSYHVDFTEAEKHGIETVLKLFTAYETQVEDYWTSVIYKWFPKPEIRMMASAFASMEGVHAVFYDKLNDGLGLSTKEFYMDWQKDPTFVKRMEMIERFLKVDKKEDLPLSLAAFAFIEGAILYSSFAFLLSFPKRNKLSNVANGIAYSVRDENLHAEADAWLFREVTNQLNVDRGPLEESVKELAQASYYIECKIIEEIFSKGPIDDITADQLKTFAASRINKKLSDMQVGKLFDIGDNPIADWFYIDINAQEQTDFFAGNVTEYQHGWDFSGAKY